MFQTGEKRSLESCFVHHLCLEAKAAKTKVFVKGWPTLTSSLEPVVLTYNKKTSAAHTEAPIELLSRVATNIKFLLQPQSRTNKHTNS